MDWKDHLAKLTPLKEGLKGEVSTEVNVTPSSFEEVEEIIRLANALNLKIYPFVGNSRHFGPSISANVGVDFSSLNKIVELSEEDLYVTAQPGVSMIELFSYVKKRGFLLPSFYDGSLGGMLGTNLPGPFSTFFGYPRDSILMGIIVTGDGKRIKAGGKTLKFSSGYKIHKLLTGSLGWYGTFLEATFKIYPYPDEMVEVSVSPNDAQQLLRSELRPIGIISFKDRAKVIFEGSSSYVRELEKRFTSISEWRPESFRYPNKKFITSISVTRGEELRYLYDYSFEGEAFLGTGYVRFFSDDKMQINGISEKGDTPIKVSKSSLLVKNALDPKWVMHTVEVNPTTYE
ncbi:FAD-binding oxidoreductase [Acidianus sp. RZ1]|uniref:FAD-binding oxidoreductase n=1 Tax=Acidianus sp. RZ1 TaxID=1540082 RepID=UPI001491E9EF|nr:FAD-binding oxidoreductase [Acidianus sp. RZ1]NON62244.1 FAD-binding oxidoreductase [Acidianus sp. RZ1]